MDPAVDQRIREARRRLRWSHFVVLGSWAFSAAVSLFALWQLVHFATLGHSRMADWPWFAISLGALIFIAALAALASWRDPLAVARQIDRHSDTKDRFVSVLALSGDPDARLIEREVAHFSKSLILPASLSARFPTRPLLVIGIALALLAVTAAVESQKQSRLAPAVADAQKTLDRAAKAVQAHSSDDPKLAKAALELEKAREKMPQSSDPARDALRALAELEKQLAAAASSGARPLSAAESSALADALAAQDPSLAAALASGPSDQTASQIQNLDPQALAQALEQAARHVQSSRLRDMARQSASQARQSLSQAFRRSSTGDASRSSSLLRELKDIKSGQPDGQGEDAQDMGLADSPPGKDPAQSKDQKDSPPGGSAGQEKDLGTGEELAQRDPEQGTLGDRDLLVGQTGEGPSELKTFRLGGSDQSKARRATSDPANPTQSATLDAVEQENIPPGSRLLVRRYFEAIRPAE